MQPVQRIVSFTSLHTLTRLAGIIYLRRPPVGKVLDQRWVHAAQVVNSFLGAAELSTGELL